MPKISIILPVYNVDKYIRKCLDSLINQTLKDIEIICVIDGSTDNSLNIIKEYANNDNRFVIIEQQNQGTGVARNNGINAAKGDYIMFCDPDDWYELDACQSAYSIIHKNKNDMVFFGMNMYYEDKGIIEKDEHRLSGFPKNIDLNNIELKKLDTMYLKSGECVHKIYNRQFLLNNNVKFTNTKMYEDYPFTLKAILHSKTVSVLDKPLYTYRIRKDSATKTYDIKYWEEILQNRELMLKEILKSPDKNQFLRVYIPSCISGMFYWEKRYRKSNPHLRKKIYDDLRKYFTKLDNCYDCSLIKSHTKYYKKFRNIIENEYNEVPLKNILSIISKNIFQMTNVNHDGNEYKSITLLGITFEIKMSLDFEKIRRNYNALIQKIKKQNRPIKVLFLVSEISKWKTQSLYDLMDKDENFEPIIALTIADIQKKLSKKEQKKLLNSNYEYFTNQKMNCVYAYDFNKNKTINLKKFNPDLVFYQQPWGIAQNQHIKQVSKYALTYYIPYYVPNYGILSMDCKLFHKLLHKYYVLNEDWAEIYRNYMKTYAGEVIGLGHTMLDNFYINQANNNSQNKNYIIYAPHWSICDINNKNTENYATFDINGKEILEYAKQHPEFNWAFKPHPTLKSTLYKIGKMTPDEIENYYNEWEKIAYCNYSDYIDLFNNSKALITDCGSFLVEYFVTGKPIIHLISSNIKTEVIGPSKKIFNTFYKIHNLNDLYDILESVIVNNKDDNKQERINVLKELNLSNNYAAKNIINDIKKELKNA